MASNWYRRCAVWALQVGGWRFVGEAPDVPSCLVVFAPHTSNWDFVLLVLVRAASGKRVSYLAKHTLFRPPFGWLFRALGGIPVERDERHHLVDRIAEAFERPGGLWLAMAPEGTRKKTNHWKSGFYYIALKAKIPLLLTFVDAGRKECGLGELVWLTGDVERDLAQIRAFYADKRGIFPEQASDVRFVARSAGAKDDRAPGTD